MYMYFWVRCLYLNLLSGGGVLCSRVVARQSASAINRHVITPLPTNP
jgi:hypothetical protein